MGYNRREKKQGDLFEIWKLPSSKQGWRRLLRRETSLCEGGAHLVVQGSWGRRPHLEPCRPREPLLKDSPWLPTTSYASTKALHFIWNVRVFHLDVWSSGCCNRISPLPWRKQTWKSKRSSREPKEAASPPHVGPRNGPPQAGGGDRKQRWSVVLLALSPSGSHLHSFHSLPGKMINSSSSWNFIGLGHRTG